MCDDTPKQAKTPQLGQIDLTPTKEEWELFFDKLPPEIQEKCKQNEARDGELFVTIHTLSDTPVVIHKPRE